MGFIVIWGLVACTPGQIVSTPLSTSAAPTGTAQPDPAPTYAVTRQISEKCSQKGSEQWETVPGVGEIGIYLPPCFNPTASRTYPSLYLLPVFGGGDRDWFLSGIIDQADGLILSGKIRPFIMVATPNTFKDFEGRFVIESLMPYLEKHFHASLERRERAVAGGSLGGATAYHLVLSHPELFASAGIFGAGAARGEETKIQGWLAAMPAGDRPGFFINCGEQDSDMLERAKVLISLLDGAGVSHTQIFGPGSHTYAYWSSNFPAFLTWLEERNF